MKKKSIKQNNVHQEVKNAVITGASSGIGLLLAQKYLESGYKVFALSRTQPQITHHNLKFIQTDLSDSQSINNAVNQLSKNVTSVAVLVNNAGAGISGATELLDIQQVRHNFELNFFGAFALTKALLPLMSSGDRIINISSTCALFALPYRSIYCASKAAINMLSLSLSAELSFTGIKVISICPGEIKTNFSKNRVKQTQTNNRYQNRPGNSASKIDQKEDKRMSAEKASNKIYKIATKGKKPLYIVGKKYKFFLLAKSILGDATFNKITSKMFS